MRVDSSLGRAALVSSLPCCPPGNVMLTIDRFVAVISFQQKR